ncbi:MAG: hypothetical protein NC923_02245 [Candidatus Omnitrophica bacterium]|nr:hypothetical protein [Candidatus Omnitrophota bacterium]
MKECDSYYLLKLENTKPYKRGGRRIAQIYPNGDLRINKGKFKPEVNGSGIYKQLKNFIKNELNKKYKSLIKYLILTSKFEQTFRDLFAFYLQIKLKGYYVAREYSYKNKRVDICILDKRGIPVHIIEVKAACCFDYVKKYNNDTTMAEKFFKDMKSQLAVHKDDKISKSGIMIVNWLTISENNNEKLYSKFIKYYDGYTSKKYVEELKQPMIIKKQDQNSFFLKTIYLSTRKCRLDICFFSGSMLYHNVRFPILFKKGDEKFKLSNKHSIGNSAKLEFQ